MLVHPKDGRCRECRGQLRIIDTCDDLMTVECTNEKCRESYDVETDAFNDGAAFYWPHVMAEKLKGARDEDD
jgi:hypothetical protein